MIKEIIINNLTHKVIMKKEDRFLGVKGENKFETLKFIFEDIFLNGEGILEIQKPNAQKEYIILEKEEDCYLLEVKNSLLNVEGEITMQLVVRTTDNRVFKSVEFTMQVLKAIEATEEISDEYKTWDTILAEKILEINKKLEELNSLEDTLDTLLSNANLQVENVENLVEEATRLKEETEKLKEQIETALSEYDTKTDEKVSEFISTYNSKIEELNTLASNLTKNMTSEANSLKTEFDENATAKTNEFNSNVETKTSEFDKEAETKLDEYNSNDTAKLEAYNKNHEAKMKLYNDNDVTKTNVFNSNAEEKTTEFNNNVTEQTNTFNQNVTTKKAEINTLAEEKIAEYNENAETKLTEFNENAESYEKRISELEQENDELAQQMPWNTTEIAESIHVEDSAKYSRNKLTPFGNLEQEKREGYNLLDTTPFADRTVNGMSFTRNEDGSILVNGTSTANIEFQIPVDFTIPAGDYSIYVPYSESVFGITVSLGYDGIITGTNVQPQQKTGDNAHCKQITFAEDTPVNQLRFYIESGVTISNYLLKWMLVKGSYTSDTIPKYEQYGVMPSFEYESMPTVATGVQKVRKCKKNMLNTYDIDVTKNGTTFKSNADGSIKIVGTRTTGTFNDFKKITSKTPLFKAGVEYTVSYGNNLNFNNQSVIAPFVWLNNINNANVLSINKRWFSGNSKKTFILSEDIYVITLGIEKMVEGTTYDENIYIQIEKGKTATDYEPHTEETFELDLGTTELCKIVDENNNVVAQDKPVYREVDGVWKWQWEKNIKKVVLNGSQSWQQSSYSDDVYLCAFLTTPASNVNPTEMVNDKLPIGDYASITDKEVIKNDKEFKIRILVSRLTKNSVQGLQEYLTSNPITIYSPVIDAIYEDCTESQSAVLDKLYKLSLTQGVNNIFVESENGVTAELQLEYMQDLMSQINELKQAMLNIGGN